MNTNTENLLKGGVSCIDTEPQAPKSSTDIELDNFINGLNYNPNTVMLTKTDPIGNNYDKESYVLEDNNLKITKRTKENVTIENDNLIAIASKAMDIYPGNLVLCDHDLAKGSPNIVNISKGGGELRIDLPLSKTGTSRISLDKISSTNVFDAIGQKVSNWKEQNPNGNVVMSMNYDIIEAISTEQLNVALGVDITAFSNNTIKVDFNYASDQKSKDYILKFDQIYYNVCLAQETFAYPSKFICTDENTVNNLKKIGVSNNAPIGVIDNVSYGRTIFVHLKSTNKTFDIKTSLNTAIKKVNTNADFKLELNNLNENTETKVFVYGGGTASANSQFITLDNVFDLIKNNYNFNDMALAAPIGYRVRYLKDGGKTTAAINSSTTILTSSEDTKFGHKLTLKNDAVVDGNVEAYWWEPEIKNGKMSGGKWVYFRNGDSMFEILLKQRKEVTVPAHAQNVTVNLVGMKFFGSYKKQKYENVDMSRDREFKITGTVFNIGFESN